MMSDFDLNDALDDLIGSEPVVRTTLRRPQAAAYYRKKGQASLRFPTKQEE